MKIVDLIKYAAFLAAILVGLFVVGCTGEKEIEILKDVDDYDELNAIFAGLIDDRYNYADGIEILPGEGESTIPSGYFGAPMPENEVTFLGYGINVFDGPTFTDALKSPLLAPAVYADKSSFDANSYFDSSPQYAQVSTLYISDKLTEVYSKLDVNAEVRTGESVPFFSGSISSQFGSTQELKSESKFYNAIFSAETKKQTIDVLYQFPELLTEILKPGIITLINSNSVTPKTLFEKVGTHIILSATIGGSANITGVYNSNTSATTQDISVALDFKSSWVEGKASTSLSDKQKAIASETQITINARGGDVSKFANVGIATAGDAMGNWAETVADKPTIAKVYQTMPIWELANASRKKVIEEYFYAHAADVNSSLGVYFSKSARPKEPVIEDGQKYFILNWLSQKAIDVSGASKDNGALLHLWDNHGGASQQWVAVRNWAYPDYWSFKNVNSGRSMNVKDGLINKQLIQWDNKMTFHFMFNVVDNGDGSVYITTVDGGIPGGLRYRVSATGGTSSISGHINGNAVVTTNTGTGIETKWKLVKVK